MNRKITDCLTLVCFFLICYIKGYSQSLVKPVFLNKQAIKNYRIYEIKDLRSFRSDSVYTLFKFNNGLLVNEADVGNDYLSVDEALSNGKEYAYDLKNRLLKTEVIESPGAHQSNSEFFKYLNGKLTLVVTTTNYWSQQLSGANLTGLEKYFYYPDKKLKYKVTYNFEIKSGMISNSQLNTFMRLPESHQQPSLITTLKAKNGEFKYYIYNKDSLVGFYPAKNKEGITDLKSDTIYYGQKINELKKIGVNDFSKKYFRGLVYDKIIDDCYIPVRGNELLINGKPIKKFLSDIRKPDSKYVILEIAEHDFHFYKILD